MFKALFPEAEEKYEELRERDAKHANVVRTQEVLSALMAKYREYMNQWQEAFPEEFARLQKTRAENLQKRKDRSAERESGDGGEKGGEDGSRKSNKAKRDVSGVVEMKGGAEAEKEESKTKNSDLPGVKKAKRVTSEESVAETSKKERQRKKSKLTKDVGGNEESKPVKTVKKEVTESEGSETQACEGLDDPVFKELETEMRLARKRVDGAVETVNALSEDFRKLQATVLDSLKEAREKLRFSVGAGNNAT